MVAGRYESIEIEEVDEGILQGYSAALDLIIRWERGELHWHDLQTGEHIPTFEQERARADAAEEGRLAAEPRVRELEAELGWRDAEG